MATKIAHLHIITKTLIIIVLFLCTLLFGLKVFDPLLGDNASGWVQTGIALVSFPVILYQINQLIQEVNKKPEISVGVVNNALSTLAKIRELSLLPTSATILRNTSIFYLIIRNSGSAPARNIKIHLEYLPLEKLGIYRSYSQFVVVKELSNDKPSFIRENMIDFVFRATPDWIINSNDIESFSFEVVTDAQYTRDDIDLYTLDEWYPKPGPMHLQCTIWSEGLIRPIIQDLYINVSKDKIL